MEFNDLISGSKSKWRLPPMASKSVIKNIHLNITKTILQRSVRNSTRCCMVAVALRERGAENVAVTAEGARFSMKNRRYYFPMPATVAVKIATFDAKGIGAINPFGFELKNGFVRAVHRRPRGVGHINKHVKPGRPRVMQQSGRRFRGMPIYTATAAFIKANTDRKGKV